MATRAQRVFGRATPSKKATAKNFHNMPSFEHGPKEQLLQTLLTNTFGQTFYTNQRDLVEQSEEVHDAAIEHEAFYAKALVFARNRGYMRTQPVYGLAWLAAIGSDQLALAFGEVIRTPNDLNDFLTILRTLKGGRGGLGGRRIKRLVGNWLTERLSEYWVIKYGAQKSDGFSLRDLLQMTHPKTDKPNPLFDYLLRQGFEDGKVTRTWGKTGAEKVEHRDVSELKQLMAFEALKAAETIEEKVKAIKEGRLPHEVATSFIGDDKKGWNALAPNLPIFALLKNLATLERHKVLESNKATVLEKLTTEKFVGRSRILPFRFVEAEKHVETGWLKDALRDAVELSFVNVPEIEGETAVMLDVSPSMQEGSGTYHGPMGWGRGYEDESKIKWTYRKGGFIEQAAVLAVAVAKKSGGNLIAFDGKAKRVHISSRDSLLTQAKQFHRMRITMRGGTSHSAAMDVLLGERKKVDNIVMITDGEQNVGRPFADALADYLAKVSRKVKVFVIDVSPHRHAMLPTGDPSTYFLYGWSDQMLSFISLVAKGWDSLAKSVDQMDLTPKVVAAKP
jgi:60 kDa SS-A/Ro ribonucleoprotein